MPDRGGQEPEEIPRAIVQRVAAQGDRSATGDHDEMLDILVVVRLHAFALVIVVIFERHEWMRWRLVCCW